MILEVGRSVRLLGRNEVVGRVVVVGKVRLEVVVGVVGRVLIAPVQGEVGVDVVQRGSK